MICLALLSILALLLQRSQCFQHHHAFRERSATNEVVSKILGGEKADLGEYPFLVAVEHIRLHQFCAATVMNNVWAISAAHCFKDYSNPEVLQARSGSLELNTGGIVHPFEKVISHPEFGTSRTLSNDISLIKVQKPFSDNPYIKYVKLPKIDRGYYLKTGTKVVSAGWGITSKSRFYGESSPILLDVTLDILDNDECSQESFFEKFAEYGIELSEDMICTETIGKDTTAGDSGGPLLIKKGNESTLIGVVSFGEGSGEPGDPGVYTDVFYYKRWIYLETVSFPE